MICMYCNTTTINEEMFVVRQATKPKGWAYRWTHLGHCCNKCEAAGKPTSIEYKNPVHPLTRRAANDWRNP